MSLQYRAVNWNRQKKIYDLTIAIAVLGYLALFIGLTFVLQPQATAETAIIRALSTGAFVLLHVILAIGPLCRLDPRFLPLLYNRRHLGVTMFLLAFAHGAFGIVQFHVGGVENPFVSLFSSASYANFAWFPFQTLGALALVILFLMASTSHDFWLANLTAPVWKSLHMLVYMAYALLVGHVALGVLQDETSPLFAILTGVGLTTIIGLHLAAAIRETHGDVERADASGDWVDVGPVEEIEDARAKVVCLSGERVAIFRYDGMLSAISNVCQHQNGPLGEGKIIDGCVTCPWHGYQYLPASGASPAPFTEKVPTFRVRVDGGRVFLHPHPNPPGTHVEPARIHTPTEDPHA